MDEAAVTAITNAVDFATVVTGIGTIGTAIALVLISMKGAKMLLGMIRGA